jgi:predicted small integral membrane protein
LTANDGINIVNKCVKLLDFLEYYEGGAVSLNARNANAQDFDRAAQWNADIFWVWLVIAGIVFWFFKWWAVIPGWLAIWSAIKSLGATSAAGKLRNGTYSIPNPNNCVDDEK